MNLEVFVTQSVRQIHDLASSRQHKQLRATCQGLLGEVPVSPESDLVLGVRY